MSDHFGYELNHPIRYVYFAKEVDDALLRELRENGAWKQCRKKW